ncbi:MAG: PAS domain-containing protein [Pseudomonadota bacterium]
MTADFEDRGPMAPGDPGIGEKIMRHADNQALVSYWNALRGGRPCPLRSEVDPRQIDCAIGHLFILEDLGRGNIRFRLAGSALVDAFWMELRGMPVHAIMASEARQSLSALVSETLDEPGVGRALLNRSGVPGGPWEIALLPLRSVRGSIDRLLGGLYPLDPADLRPPNPPLTFTIEEMTITPVTVMASSEAPVYQGGMAEAPMPWVHDGAAARHLRAIDGGLSEAPDTAEQRDVEPQAPAGRPRLRIVKSDD